MEALRDNPGTEKRRTLKQNAALWTYCQAVAQEFREKGWDMDKIFEVVEFRIAPSKEMIKETFVDTVTDIMYPGRSSSKLSRDEFRELVNVLQMNFAQRYDISTPFGWEQLRER